VLPIDHGRACSLGGPFLARTLRFSGLPGQAVAVMLGEQPLTDTEGLRGHFKQFVICQKLHSIVQRQLPWGLQADAFFGGAVAHVGEVLLLANIDFEVTLAYVLAYHLTLININARPKKELTALLRPVQPECGRYAVLPRNK